MKRCCFIIFSLFNFCIAGMFMTASAQVGEYRTDFAVGVNGGYMMNKISFQPDVPQDMMGGLTGGLTLRYTCEKYFKSICAIVAEVNYAQMGWKENIEDINNQPVYYYDDTEKLNPLFYERRINYVQIPVMARLGWGRERKGFQGFFQIGPQIGVYLDNKYSGLISFRIDWLNLLYVQGTLKSPNTSVQKHQFFGTQLSLWSNSHIHT